MPVSAITDCLFPALQPLDRKSPNFWLTPAAGIGLPPAARRRNLNPFSNPISFEAGASYRACHQQRLPLKRIKLNLSLVARREDGIVLLQPPKQLYF